MTNSKLLLGSDYPSSGEMFIKTDNNSFSSLDEISKYRLLERQIYLDINDRFNKLCKLLELKRLEEITIGESIVYYPNPEEWVAHRLKNDRGTKYYPSFVKDELGEIYFIKVYLSPLNSQRVQTEIDALQIIPAELNSPKLINSGLVDTYPLSFIILESVLPNEGSVKPISEWTDEYISDAILKIHNLEDIKIDLGNDQNSVIRKKDLEISNFLILSINDSEEILNKFTDFSLDYTGNLLSKLKELLKTVKLIPQCVSHGDLTDKNILIIDNKAVFIDFELYGIGLLGQDAAKLLTSMKGKNYDYFIEKYLINTYKHSYSLRAQGLTINKVAEKYTHILWRINEIKRLENSDSPEKIVKINQFKKEIKSFFLEIDSYISI